MKYYTHGYALASAIILLFSCQIRKGPERLINHIQHHPDLSLSDNEMKEFETVFLSPTNREHITGTFDKVEIGIKLPPKINELTAAFLNNDLKTYPNPYNPDHINIEAYFINEQDTFKTFAFFYWDFQRDLKNNKSWRYLQTDYVWRIRFAPPRSGQWTCNIVAKFPGSGIEDLNSSLNFSCVENNKKGFISTAGDNRHLTYPKDSTIFMGIGQNIPWTDGPMFKGKWLNYGTPGFYCTNENFDHKIYLSGFQDINDFIKDAGANHANLVRVVSWQESYIFEWEERGVYGSNRHPQDQDFLRQQRAWELDQLFEAAEFAEVKLIFCMEFHGQYTYDWNNGKTTSFFQNPYRAITTDSVALHLTPIDFFSNPDLKKSYQNKLRYFLARWGYSPSLGVLQLLSEFNSWSADSTDHSKRLTDLLKKDEPTQKNVYQWHDEMGAFIHKNTCRPILVTSGLTSDINPIHLRNRYNIYNSENIDLVVWNRYGNEQSINYKMYLETDRILNKFTKPFLFTETGLLMDPVKNADPGDIEGCDDQMFHNFLWAGSAFGAASASLEWWQHFDNERRKDFNAMYQFFSTIDFNRYNFTENDFWSDLTPRSYFCGNVQKMLHKDSKIEVYMVKSINPEDKKPDALYGWAHNTTAYWMNMPEYMNCRDRSNQSPSLPPCYDDNYESIFPLDSSYQITFNRLKPKTYYTITWHSTFGNGGVINRQNYLTDGWGKLIVNWPGNHTDYAFSIERDEKWQK